MPRSFASSPLSYASTVSKKQHIYQLLVIPGSINFPETKRKITKYFERKTSYHPSPQCTFPSPTPVVQYASQPAHLKHLGYLDRQLKETHCHLQSITDSGNGTCICTQNRHIRLQISKKTAQSCQKGDATRSIFELANYSPECKFKLISHIHNLQS